MDRHNGAIPRAPATPFEPPLSLTPSISTVVFPIMTLQDEVPCATSPTMTFGDTLSEIPAPSEPPIDAHARALPPPEPPPTDIFPPCSIIADLMRAPDKPTICITKLNLRADQELDSTLALLPFQIPSILDSVTRVVTTQLP